MQAMYFTSNLLSLYADDVLLYVAIVNYISIASSFISQPLMSETEAVQKTLT